MILYNALTYSCLDDNVFDSIWNWEDGFGYYSTYRTLILDDII